MAHGAASLMRQRLFDNLADLTATETNILEAERHRADAHAAFVAAEVALNTLQERRTFMLRTTRHLRNGLRTMATFPDFLLALIFEHACVVCERTAPIDDADIAAVIRAYRLSSVCRHWRSVALKTPTIWSYLAVADYDMEVQDRAVLFARLDRHILLSKATLLDVSIIFDTMNWADDTRAREYKWQLKQLVPPLIARLVSCASRIRSLKVHRRDNMIDPVDILRDGILDLLRCPTLESLIVRLPHASPPVSIPAFWLTFSGQDLPIFLPEAPRLQLLRMEEVPLVCPMSHPGLPALTSVTLEYQWMIEIHLWSLLFIAPNISELSINCMGIHDLPDRFDIRPTSLPRIKSLGQPHFHRNVADNIT